jgi:hypothetical protein
MAGHAIFFTPTTLNACRRLPHFVLHVFSNLILENIPHEEVFRGCTIIGIFFDSCIAKRDKQIDMKSCLSEASSLNDYDNRTSGLRAQDVFAPFFVSFLSVMKEMKNPHHLAGIFYF